MKQQRATAASALEAARRGADMAALPGVPASVVREFEAGQWRISKNASTITAMPSVSVGCVLHLNCPQCGCGPPVGYPCLRCGTIGDPAPGVHG